MCNICCRKVQSFCIKISCNNCLYPYHAKCVNFDREEVIQSVDWYCPPCMKKIFPYNHYDDDNDFLSALAEGMFNCSIKFSEIDQKIFHPFEVNDDVETPLTEKDPDFQFYSDIQYIHNTKCDYYFEDCFREKIASSGRDKDKMSFFHLNIKSLPKHLNELEMYLDSLNLNFSFIGLSETWLDGDKKELYYLSSYNSVNKYRHGKRGGGVSVYVKENIPFTERNDLVYFDSEMESVFIEIESNVYNTTSNIIIGVIYRIPNTSVSIFNDRVTDILNIVRRENKLCYFMGDFNLDLLKHEEHNLTSEFLNILYSCSVFPLITKPTRVTSETATLIDFILTNNLELNSRHTQGILCCSISDHYGVFHITDFSPKCDTEEQVLVKRDMSNRNVQRFISEVARVDWNDVINTIDTQIAYTKFQTTITNLYNKCFPYRKTKKKYFNRKPWLTSEMKHVITVKNKLFRDLHKGVGNDEKTCYYKRFRNRLNHTLKAAERKYYKDLLCEYKSNLKKSWQILKSIINKRKSRTITKVFKCNGTEINDGQEISEKFNNFFVNVGPSLAQGIPLSSNDPTDYMRNKVHDLFTLSEVTDNEVSKIIGNFKDTAAGWDDLKPGVMKKIKDSIKCPLAHIANLSFSSGTFPKELKIANVVPLFKSGDDMIFTNYRPVSVLPVFSKLLERLMFTRLIDFLTLNDVLDKYQFGFQKGKSTYMALITLIDKITKALDNGDIVIGVFLDFSKAFDTVDHKILLKKLEWYGIRNAPLKWFHDYLNKRYQYVTYNSTKSSEKSIKCGVPQGSILGPLLFLLYINDLPTVSEACLNILFADDTNMFITGNDIDYMCRKMNSDLSMVQEWLCCNKLSLNICKTHYMVFTSRNKHVNDIDIKINGVKIDRVYSTKFLGVMIDSKLTWKSHIDYMSSKLSKCVGILAKCRKTLYKSALISLYYSFAYPYLIYCNHVWGNNYQINLEKIFILQKKLIRIVTCSPYRAHTEPLFVANNVLTVYDINTYVIGMFMYKCMNEGISGDFRNYFVRNSDINEHYLRNTGELRIPYARLDVTKFSVRVNGAKVWNSIPCHIKNSNSACCFKRHLREHILSKKTSVIITQY